MSWRAYMGRTLRELKVLYHPEAIESTGARNFVNKNLFEITALNPNFSFFGRVEDSDSPRLLARYDWGKEDCVPLANKTEAEIDEIVEALVHKGWSLPRSPESEDYADRLSRPASHGDGWKAVLDKYGCFENHAGGHGTFN